jgi:hypothetical protein
VWQIKSNPANIGTPFFFSFFERNFSGRLCRNTNRFFFFLRFYLVTPLRKPCLAENESWVGTKLILAAPNEEAKNLILNVAIGYPF